MGTNKTHSLSMDPGVNGTGYAVWRAGSYWDVLEPPVSTGIITAHTSTSWDQRARQIVQGLSERVLVRYSGWDFMYLEYPEFFDSGGGQMVARRGDLVKLAVLTGALWGYFGVDRARLIPVHEWKGQLPKSVVSARIRRLLGRDACRDFQSHVWDAVGVGLFAKGHF